jgi:outer membrane lipoprotein-sorting protein
MGSAGAALGVCGPFTDVTDAGFCPFILEIFTLGITTGTSATTYDPTANVTRIQMAAFLSRTVDTTLKRSAPRTAINQLWTPRNGLALNVTSLGGTQSGLIQFDGADLWVAHFGNNRVTRARASDGRLLETWSGADSAYGVLVAMNSVFVTGSTNPGKLYRINPSQPAGAVEIIATDLGVKPLGIAFDGEHIWTANIGPIGSVSMITPDAALPWPVTSMPIGIGATSPIGVLFDGSSVWVTDGALNTVVKMDPSGAVLQTVTVGTLPTFPVFDGTSVWVPNSGSASVTVIRASNGTVLQTLTGNGLSNPGQAAFDGQRILVVNGNESVSLWKAADLTPLGSFSTVAGLTPGAVCSDGTSFWIVFFNGKLARF